MSVSVSHTPSILIVESNIAQRRKLIDAVLDTDLTRDIREAQSVAEAQELLANETYEICFVGSGLSEITQKTFIHNMTHNEHIKTCVFIPLCKSPNKENVMEFVQAGAHGVLVVPIQPEAIRRVIETAFQTKQANVSDKIATAAVASLPELLESVARRLNLAAQRMQHDHINVSNPATVVKLLNDMVSASTSDLHAPDEDIALKLIHLVKRAVE